MNLPHCPACGNKSWQWRYSVSRSDKYEKTAGLTGIRRAWYTCRECSVYYQNRNYKYGALAKIYADGYRSPFFRDGKSVSELHEQISNLPFEQSENKKRVKWLLEHLPPDYQPRRALDLGAGLNVFLPEVKKYWPSSQLFASDPNPQTRIVSEPYGITFFETAGFPDACSGVDFVSCIHVLEHVPDPMEFLSDISLKSSPDCLIFIEVPDNEEFYYLDEDNDEFNSCHLWFFDRYNMTLLLERVGLEPMAVESIFHQGRNLTRLMALAGKGTSTT